MSMKTIRTIIIDDEPLAREGIKELLHTISDIEVIGECSNAVQAVEQILDTKPDLIFLDIQMPEMDGFDVIRMIKDKWLPAVIFVTAYDDFAIKAFEVHAIDYLLKPVNPKRFTDALQHARESFEHGSREIIFEQLRNLMKDVNKTSRTADRIAVRVGSSIVFVKINDIEWIEAEGDYVMLHTREKDHLVRGKISEFEERLDPKDFLRIHRSVIVNVGRIKELSPLFSGEYSVTLLNGTKLRLSRTYKEKLDILLDRFH
jgi:two-component system LytT family response regulator